MKKYLPIIILLCTFGIHTCAQGKLYAVLVGVSEYRDASDNLTSCHRDAIEMYDLLKRHTSPSNLTLLTNRRACRDSILRAAADLFTKTHPEDIVVFFFSGHGNSGCFYAHDKILPFKSLQAIFRKTKANRKLIFADACFSGTLRTSQPHTDTGATSMGSNVLLFLSSRSNQTSIDEPSLKNGLFTFFLLAGLRGGADANRDRTITAKELFDFVGPKVKEQSRGEQAPVMWGKFDDNMPIIVWK
jgi:uncharacterized caspase-like protein